MSFLKMLSNKFKMPEAGDTLPGRDTPVMTPGKHVVNGRNLDGPYPEGMKVLYVGMGCYWGAERAFWELPGVYVTAVGFSGGLTKNPTYHETCTGQTGHTEVVKVVYNPAEVSLVELLKTFWERHDPTQGMRQGNDVGTQYRSAIYLTDTEDIKTAKETANTYQQALKKFGNTTAITTEIEEIEEFYYAEEYHQQYLARNPEGYCGLRGTGATCPLPVSPSSLQQ
ncbi:peptide-methionine (S)-S-oxide reductase MsrA [Pseudovibrio sp. Tun.PSC04-5.I4]|uniref:peptide-methionine (S)-S-oxide reductase MsrA n=1 Tax=Pseudovibrio sp. Tun.PSC04-5.I4 TaxID=1798213 RepID=UPI0008833B7F|nr:peptide-methionine (S)-S-oxide reductase MsrA [Pseudovibrio sp. Tun.PSC04-5.I4]SDR20392.1 peptide-methionine (S)-S-oxide reductase [Pseudovibrio sp. Tun.PSC04-5.I4]